MSCSDSILTLKKLMNMQYFKSLFIKQPQTYDTGNITREVKMGGRKRSTNPQPKYRSSVCLLIYWLFILVEFDVGLCHEDEGAITVDGDIILGGLFPIHKKSQLTENKCGVFNEIPGYQYMEAMLFAINKINNDSNLLPNITLGAQIYDTCQSQTIAADRAKEFIKLTLDKSPAKKQLAGVVGAFSSGVSETVANFLRVFEIPQISYSSTSVTLSNKDIYSYFMRTVAPDSFQARALVDIIRKFGWTYVSTVNSAGTYGTKGMEIFRINAKQYGICIDWAIELEGFPSTQDYKEAIEKLVERATKSNVSAVVLFCTQTDLRGLLEAANATEGARRFTWIGSDGWSNRFDVTATVPAAAAGALTIMVRRGKVLDEFREYFKSLNWENYPWKNKKYFQAFWQSRFNCLPRGVNQSQHLNTSASCQGNENLKNLTIEFSPVRVVINAVYAFAHALDSLQKELCGDQVGVCNAMSGFQRTRLLAHLKNVSFLDPSLNITIKFDKNGEVSAIYDIMNFRKEKGLYSYVHVADWDGELVDGKIEGELILKKSIKWLQGTSKVPESFCSSDCSPGATRVSKQTFDFKCCWQCKMCEKLQIVRNNTCEHGPEGWVPNANKTDWVKRKVMYPRWNDGLSVFLVFIALVCLGLTLITVIVFVVHKDNRIVKASGRELCYVMLAGISLCFIVPFLFIAKPNDPLCYTRKLVTALALAMCYAPLFMKINRIYRIFTSAKSSVARPPMVTPRVQLLVTFGLVSIQLMFTTLWFIAKPVEAIEKYYSDREELVLECKVDKLSFSVNLFYVIVLMVLCTIYAFKTRNFPKNFNESKYIGITMYITCAMWIAFFPFYLNTDYSFTHIYLISGSCVSIGLVTLTGLFAQKLYIVFYVHDIKTDDLVVSSQKKSTITERGQRMSSYSHDPRTSS